MKNYKDYIGKTFKGFKFEDKKHSNLSYNSEMDKFIGKDLKIINYYEFLNCFETDSDSGWYYPADLVIAELEKQTFKPKRGDKVLVWDDNEENAKESIFLCGIEGAIYPYFCVNIISEEAFINGDKFNVCAWKNIKPIPKKEIPKDTLVWCKNSESWWFQMYYSHFENGKHYCFMDQKKSNKTPGTRDWNIVTDKNPFE